MNAILNALLKLLIRIFVPRYARDLKHEGQFDFRKKIVAPGDVDPSIYINVEDNGSDVTVISFAGMALLYAGMPRFEFRKTLRKGGHSYNLIFVRDVHRAYYCMAPDGSPSGLAFFEGLLRDALSRLNSKYNVAIGSSGGASVAFCLSRDLPIHQIIAFNATFPLEIYSSRVNRRAALFDFRKLITAPRAYIEVVLITFGGRYVCHRICQLLGEENVPDITQCYLSKRPRPARATIYYSAGCRPDAEQALLLKEIPTITIKPVNCNRHNFMADWTLSGRMGQIIQEEIEAGLAGWRKENGNL
jgi:hypothetical protein